MQLLGIISVSFESSKTSGYAIYQIGGSIGVFTIFIAGLFITVIIQLWIILGVLVMCTVTYTVFILSTMTKEQLVYCSFCERNKTSR